MNRSGIWIWALFCFSCDWPFNTEETEGEVFGLTVSLEVERIVDSAAVELSWDPVSVENFSHFRIERQSTADSDWVFIEDVENALSVSYKDYIQDDEDLDYRVGIMDINENGLWAEGSASVPRTTRLYVPDEWSSPAKAFKSALIDNGDSILVKSGEYTDTLSMVGKSVYVASISELDTVVLLARVWMNTGVLKGFTIRDVLSGHQQGGGVFISGNGLVLNCFIRDNWTGRNGGGVYLREGGSLYNSVLFNNSSDNGSMNLYVEDAYGKVVNNTFVLAGDLEYDDNVTVSKLESGFEFLNNIVFGSNIFKVSLAGSDSIVIDYSRLNSASIAGDSSITDDPRFTSLDATFPDLHLLPDSPCIHAGHPGQEYNNVDGTRNTMGAYGGPLGE